MAITIEKITSLIQDGQKLGSVMHDYVDLFTLDPSSILANEEYGIIKGNSLLLLMLTEAETRDYLFKTEEGKAILYAITPEALYAPSSIVSPDMNISPFLCMLRAEEGRSFLFEDEEGQKLLEKLEPTHLLVETSQPSIVTLLLENAERSRHACQTLLQAIVIEPDNKSFQIISDANLNQLFKIIAQDAGKQDKSWFYYHIGLEDKKYSDPTLAKLKAMCKDWAKKKKS